jgi:hypothetical protein
MKIENRNAQVLTLLLAVISYLGATMLAGVSTTLSYVGVLLAVSSVIVWLGVVKLSNAWTTTIITLVIFTAVIACGMIAFGHLDCAEKCVANVKSTDHMAVQSAAALVSGIMLLVTLKEFFKAKGKQ